MINQMAPSTVMAAPRNDGRNHRNVCRTGRSRPRPRSWTEPLGPPSSKVLHPSLGAEEPTRHREKDPLSTGQSDQSGSGAVSQCRRLQAASSHEGGGGPHVEVAQPGGERRGRRTRR
jgi:hypothetical protein